MVKAGDLRLSSESPEPLCCGLRHQDLHICRSAQWRGPEKRPHTGYRWARLLSVLESRKLHWSVLRIQIANCLLRMTHRYINKGRNWSRLFVRERVELLIERSGRWLKTNIGFRLQSCTKNWNAVPFYVLCVTLYTHNGAICPETQTYLQNWS